MILLLLPAAIALYAIFVALFLFLPWRRLPNRAYNLPLWCRLWGWGWLALAQGIGAFFAVQDDTVNGRLQWIDFCPLLGGMLLLAAPILWIVAFKKWLASLPRRPNGRL